MVTHKSKRHTIKCRGCVFIGYVGKRGNPYFTCSRKNGLGRFLWWRNKDKYMTKEDLIKVQAKVRAKGLHGDSKVSYSKREKKRLKKK